MPGLAHLYVLCKGGDGDVGRSQLFLMCANQSVPWIEDENPRTGCISPHLCQNRKGGPATWSPTTPGGGIVGFYGGGFGCTIDGLPCGGAGGTGVLGGNGTALLPSGLSTVTQVDGGFAFPTVAADGSINYSFSFDAAYKGVPLTNAALAEILGLPADALAQANNGLHPTTIDKYNTMHPGMINLRDSNWFCSTHVLVDPSTGQTESHVDLFNPEPTQDQPSPTLFWLHIIYDAAPDKIYRWTGVYPVPPGRSLRQ